MNKKAITETVTISMLLLVTIIVITSLNSWYLNFNETYKNKNLQNSFIDKNKIKIMDLKTELLKTYIYVKSETEGYSIIESIKVNNQNCNLTQSNVLKGKAINKIKLQDCAETILTDNDIVILTKGEIIQGNIYNTN